MNHDNNKQPVIRITDSVCWIDDVLSEIKIVGPSSSKINKVLS